jgi:hypothetical protein
MGLSKRGEMKFNCVQPTRWLPGWLSRELAEDGAHLIGQFLVQPALLLPGFRCHRPLVYLLFPFSFFFSSSSLLAKEKKKLLRSPICKKASSCNMYSAHHKTKLFFLFLYS